MTIVTISRGSYTGGIAVAERLAEELGCPCVSREVIMDAAQESGIAEERIQKTFEEPPRFLQQQPGRMASHLNFVRAALLRRASGGDLVYHGLAAHLLLEGIPHVLRVRIIDDREARIEAAMEDKHLSRKEADQFITRLDGQLGKWTRFLYAVDWNDPSLYDVVLNLESMSVGGAVEAIAAMSRLKDFQATEESRKAFADLLLSSVVWAALNKDPRTREATVQVAADDGSVFITGSAEHQQTLTAVSEVAAGVDGVTEVTSEVGVGRHWQW
jgi:cytidylate kinase